MNFRISINEFWISVSECRISVNELRISENGNYLHGMLAIMETSMKKLAIYFPTSTSETPCMGSYCRVTDKVESGRAMLL